MNTFEDFTYASCVRIGAKLREAYTASLFYDPHRNLLWDRWSGFNTGNQTLILYDEYAKQVVKKMSNGCKLVFNFYWKLNSEHLSERTVK